jgi:hypothetical protein
MNSSNFCGNDFNGTIKVGGNFTVIINKNNVEQVIDDPKALKTIIKTSNVNYKTVDWDEFLVKYVQNASAGISAVVKATGLSANTCWGRQRAMLSWGWNVPKINSPEPPAPMSKEAANAIIAETKRNMGKSSKK